MISVIVVVETRFYRDGLARALARSGSLAVIGDSGSWRDALSLVDRSRPDIVLLDVGFTRGQEAVRAINVAAPRSRVIALSVDDAVEPVLRLAEAGISGYVTRDQTLDELIAVIESVATGEMPCSPRVAGGLLRRLGAVAASPAIRSGEAVLTPREFEIVDLISAGLSNREIATQLCIEVSTVKNHIHNILEKLHVTRRDDAVAYVRSHARLELVGDR